MKKMGQDPVKTQKCFIKPTEKETFIFVLYQKKHELGSSFLLFPFPVLKEIKEKFNPLNLLYDN